RCNPCANDSIPPETNAGAAACPPASPRLPTQNPLATPGRARIPSAEKGKVEAGMKYAQNNAVKGRSFESLAAQNLFLGEWEQNVADTRIHGTTRRQVAKLFEEVERAALQPLPAGLFPVFEEARRTIHRDGYVEFKRAY